MQVDNFRKVSESAPPWKSLNDFLGPLTKLWALLGKKSKGTGSKRDKPFRRSLQQKNLNYY